MSHAGFWIIGLSIIFMLGSVLGLRISPHEKALGTLRDRARKLGLQPRLVPLPTWFNPSDKLPASNGAPVSSPLFKTHQAITPEREARLQGYEQAMQALDSSSKIHQMQANRAQTGNLIAYYHLVFPQVQLPLLQAQVINQRLWVVHGSPHLNDYAWPLAHTIAIDMQANSVGLYWHEIVKLTPEATDHLLMNMKTALTGLVQYVQVLP